MRNVDCYDVVVENIFLKNMK